MASGKRPGPGWLSCPIWYLADQIESTMPNISQKTPLIRSGCLVFPSIVSYRPTGGHLHLKQEPASPRHDACKNPPLLLRDSQLL
jgi:hypothetical protein